MHIDLQRLEGKLHPIHPMALTHLDKCEEGQTGKVSGLGGKRRRERAHYLASLNIDPSHAQAAPATSPPLPLSCSCSEVEKIKPL